MIAAATADLPPANAQFPVANGVRGALPAVADKAASFLTSLLDVAGAVETPAPPSVPGMPLTSPRKNLKGKEDDSKSDANPTNPPATTAAIPVPVQVNDTTPLLLRLLQFGLVITPPSDKLPSVQQTGSKAVSDTATTPPDAEPKAAAAPPADLAFALRLTDSAADATSAPAVQPANQSQPDQPQPQTQSQPQLQSGQSQPAAVKPAQPAPPVQAIAAATQGSNQTTAQDTNHNPKQPHDDESSAPAKSEPVEAAPAMHAAAAAVSNPSAAVAAPVITSAPAASVTPAPVRDTAPAAHTAPADTIDKPAAAAPAQRISLSISDSQNQHVEVHLMERAGEVRVSVHAGDDALSHSMRADLGSLSGKLTQSGYNTESFTPAASNTTNFSNERQASEGRDSGAGSRQNSQQNPSGGQQQQAREGRGERPAWVEELENSLTSNAAIRSNTPWRQA